jgi:hypothetical protein
MSKRAHRTTPVVLTPTHHWHCPSCGLESVTHEARPHARMHACAKLRGLTVPMLQAGTKGKIEVHEREDYVGKELVQLDPELGRPVMSVVTTRDDGQDCTVYAPAAQARLNM